MIKLNWLRGKSFGLALLYLGIMGLFQILFITVAQYGMKIGSRPITILVPIAVILATFYCVLVIFESYTSMNEYRSSHTLKHSKYAKNKGFLSKIIKNIYVRPVFYVVIIFSGIFFFTWLILFAFFEQNWIVFAIVDNVAALGLILITAYIEKANSRKTR
jgi:hypothetical protein